MMIVPLTGAWEMQQESADSALFPATVPGCVHLDLLAAGRILRDQFISELKAAYSGCD